MGDLFILGRKRMREGEKGEKERRKNKRRREEECNTKGCCGLDT